MRISARKKVTPSRKILARAFAKQKKEVSEKIAERVFSEKSENAMFREVVAKQFEEWREDRTPVRQADFGNENLLASQSQLERKLSSVKGATAKEDYDLKKGKQGTNIEVSYKIAAEKGPEIKYTTGSEANASYKLTGDTAETYKNISTNAYSEIAGKNISDGYSCGSKSCEACDKYKLKTSLDYNK